MHFFAFFLQKNLHMSKICCTFAPNLEKKQELYLIKSKIHKCIFNIPPIRYNSQIITYLLTTKIMPL